MKSREWNYSGTIEKKTSIREQVHHILARKVAEEAVVLLKNEAVLPLSVDMPVALLGSGAQKTVKGGIGSGDVNNRRTISVCQGMLEAGAVITSKEWLADYEKRYEQARKAWKELVLEEAKRVENPFDAYAKNPFRFPEGRAVKEQDIKGAEAAVYVLSRISGEGSDRREERGDYELSFREQEDLMFLNEKKIPVVLLLNTGGPVELSDILGRAENIRAVLSISQPGQAGGTAVADILFGRVTPSGKLTATWAEHYGDYPSADTYGYRNGDLEKEEYREGIFVGYRHFDRENLPVLFPFGYGLSYTSFRLKLLSIHEDSHSLELAALVQNTGQTYAGKETVQVYAVLPQNGMEKEKKRLVGFAKTKCLQPKEKQQLQIKVEKKVLASFSEELGAWCLGAGAYGILIGEDSQNLEQAGWIYVEKLKILEQTCRIDQTHIDSSEMDNVEETVVCLTEKLPVEKLIPLLYGHVEQNSSTLGAAGIRVPGSAGETTHALEQSCGIRPLIMADGPAGIRLHQSYEVDTVSGRVYGKSVLGALENGYLEPLQKHENASTYYQYCTAFPVGTAMAQTWNPKLLQAFGRAVAQEMKEFQIDLWLAPGMNIQRNPLCGRNFEYYSEDPFLTGKMAAAVVRGVQEDGSCGAVIKHFACNNQEDNRMGVDVHISERALREIYLRGFEIAVKESAPLAIMTSYNQINGIHAANSRALCSVIARKEWGFGGVFMTDWSTTAPADGSVPWKCIEAGNDLIMPGSAKDDENIRKAYADGILSERQIRVCAGRLISLIDKLDKKTKN